MGPPPLHRNREFVALWIGNAVSWLGISILSFAYPLVLIYGAFFLALAILATTSRGLKKHG